MAYLFDPEATGKIQEQIHINIVAHSRPHRYTKLVTIKD